MSKTYYLKRGNTYRVSSDAAMDLHDTLPVGNYSIKFDPLQGFFFEEIENFNVPTKIYGDTEKIAARFVNTFQDRPSTTGVLLCGEKGSGKTLLAKMIALYGQKQGIPTLIINQPYVGEAFNTFLSTIKQPVFILFDEFEKVYPDDEQMGLLTLLDGMFGGKKLYLMTANDRWKINSHMKNRPGRFFYYMEFGSLGYGFIREYCLANLKDTSVTEQICVLSALFDSFNFDMLQAVVEEINRYGESPKDVLDYLNVKPSISERGDYRIMLTVDGVDIESEKLNDPEWSGNPFSGIISVNYLAPAKKKANPDFVPKTPYLEEFSLVVEDDEEYNENWKRASFSPKHIVSFDAVRGVLKFQNGSNKLTLTKIVEENFDFKRYAEL